MTGCGGTFPGKDCESSRRRRLEEGRAAGRVLEGAPKKDVKVGNVTVKGLGVGVVNGVRDPCQRGSGTEVGREGLGR